MLHFYKVVDESFQIANKGELPNFQTLAMLTCLHEDYCIEFQMFLNLRIEREALTDLKQMFEYLFKTNLELGIYSDSDQFSCADHRQTMKTVNKEHFDQKRAWHMYGHNFDHDEFLKWIKEEFALTYALLSSQMDEGLLTFLTSLFNTWPKRFRNARI